MNEITSKFANRIYQTLILLPYMISWVVCGYLVNALLSSETGLINLGILSKLGIEPIVWYQEKKYWPFIILLVYIWKNIGFSMVIYLASIVGISKEYYEAAKSMERRSGNRSATITLPLLKPTSSPADHEHWKHFLLRLRTVLSDSEKLRSLYDVTQTIDTYVYNALMQQGNIALSAAAGFYQSIVGFVLVVIANAIVRKYSKESALF